MFSFPFTASISCFILHFVVSNTIYSWPYRKGAGALSAAKQPQIKGRGKIAVVIRTAVGLQPTDIVICLEEKQQWEAEWRVVCVSCGSIGSVGLLLQGIFSFFVFEVLLI